MAVVEVDEGRLHVRFSWREAVLGLVHDLDLPLSEVESVGVPRDAWAEVRGLRIGLALPGVWLLGTWLRRGHRQLVALRRDQKAVRIRVRHGRYDDLLIGVPHPLLVVEQLRRGGVRVDGHLPAEPLIPPD